ncbi:IS1182 family transposase, partial [Comamonadaceae bacterium G21597-S1]|nr:IS1182 family transposase [Comamonadaceae bacterium G21597-S1]
VEAVKKSLPSETCQCPGAPNSASKVARDIVWRPVPMPRFKPQERNGLLLAVVLSEQIVPGSYAFALDYLVDHELDLSELDARFRNDAVGASAYDPRVMLKIVLLAYSRGLISSRAIERACERDVQFMAISGDNRPCHAHIARFVSGLSEQIKPLFAQVLMTCDAQGLIGREMFAIDGVKLPSNASKERSGTHAELLHRAERLERAADKIVAEHQAQDKSGQELPQQRQRRVDELSAEARRMRAFVAERAKRLNAKGQEIKSNVTDQDSAKMATSKGVIQGYAAQAAVDSAHQVIVAADVIGSGSEQSMLQPMIAQSRVVGDGQTLYTADAGYHSEDNIAFLHDQAIPALIADNAMRQRDERFKDQGKYKPADDVLYDKRAKIEKIIFFKREHFTHNAATDTYTCPAGKTLWRQGKVYDVGRGRTRKDYRAMVSDCGRCSLRAQCLRKPGQERRSLHVQSSAAFDPHHPGDRMRAAIDSPRGRRLYSQRMGTVEPVFANIRHNKRLQRFNLRGKAKVNTQWHLYCLVHNIEKLAKAGIGGSRNE